MDIITLALCKRMGKSKADIDGVYPNLIAGGVVESEVRDEDFSNKVTEHTGTAYINSIKGNTIVWNQLVENGNFADGVGRWTAGGTNTLSVTDGVCKIQSTSTSTNNHHLMFPDPSIFQNGHTYLLRCEARAYGNMIGGSIFFAQQTNYISIGTLDGLESLTSAWQSGYLLFNRNDLTLTNGKRIVIGSLTTVTTDDYFELKNICVFDLTMMFGTGNEPTSASEFASLFSLPYYAYNAGTLLSFNGTGIKTTGKNFVNVDFELLKVRNSLGTWNGNEYTYQGVTFKVNFTSQGYIDSVVVNGTATANANLNLMRLLRPSTFFNKPITMSGCPSGGSSTKYRITLQMQTSPYTVVGHDYGNGLNTTIPDNGEDYQVIIRVISGYTCNNVVFKPMITFQGVDQTFEPYTTSTLSLPISTYFPTGMKSAGNVYDELTPRKAVTRIGAVDLGTLNWTYNENYGMYTGGLIDVIKKPSTAQTKANVLCANRTIATWSQVFNSGKESGLCGVADTGHFGYSTTETDPSTFKQSMSGVYLYYELATETEVDVNLDLSYKTYEGGTEQLLPENGSVPVTSPMKTNVEFDFDENINALLDKMLNMIAPVETSPTSNAYSVGQYLIYDYVLYKVTSAIASGGTITVGTNVEATTIASVLESL